MFSSARVNVVGILIKFIVGLCRRLVGYFAVQVYRMRMSDR